MSQKYGLKILNSSQEDFSYKGEEQVLLKLEKMKKFEFDEKSQIVKLGPGWTLQEVNEFLFQQGYWIPIQDKNEKRIYELFNHNDGILSELSGFEYKNFKELIKSCLIIISDGKSIYIDQNEGIGMDQMGLYLGCNGQNGILGEIEFFVQKIPQKVFKNKLCFKNLQQQQFMQIIDKLNQIQRESLQTDPLKTSYELDKIDNKFQNCFSTLSFKDQTGTFLKSNFDKIFHPNTKINFLNDDFVSLNNEEIKNDYLKQRNFTHNNNTIQLEFKLNQKNFCKNIVKLIDYLNLFQYKLKIDFFTKFIQIQIPKSINQDILEQNIRHIADFITHKDGIFVSCSSKRFERPLLSFYKVSQFGMNNYKLSYQIKKLLDPKNTLNDTYYDKFFI